MEVTVTQTETGTTRSAVTNETGSYVLSNLPIGPYRLEAALPGFRTFVQTGIVLQVNGSPVINPATGLSSQCNNSGTNFCSPVQIGAPPAMQSVATGDPNSFSLYDLSNAYQTQADYCKTHTIATAWGVLGGATPNQQIDCTAALYILHPELLAGRNQFRTPGYWTTNFAVLKDFRMPWKESHKLQLRAEFFDLFNHANLYAVAGTNVFSGAGSFVQGARGLSPSSVKERRNIQIALRYQF